MLHHSCTPNHGVCHHCLGSLPTLCRIAINWNRSSDVLLRLHATGTTEQPVWQQWWTIWSGSHWRPDVITNGWPCFIVCNITWCLLLQLITLLRFSGHTAEDQVMTKCIKFLMLAPRSTSTPSFQQLYTCGTVFITDTDSRDHRPHCVIIGLLRDALYWKMNSCSGYAMATAPWTLVFVLLLWSKNHLLLLLLASACLKLRLSFFQQSSHFSVRIIPAVRARGSQYQIAFYQLAISLFASYQTPLASLYWLVKCIPVLCTSSFGV